MPPKSLSPDEPHQWLNRARSNLAQAKLDDPEIFLEDRYFNAQQAAEKAIKALLLHRNIQFPFIHDLGELMRILEEGGETIPDSVRDAWKLTDYAVEARHPGLAEPVTQNEYEEAVALAEEIVSWVGSQL